MSFVQSILFDNKQFTTIEAEKWLKSHGLVNIKPVHETKNRLRYRIRDPNEFQYFQTKSAGSKGVKVIFGF